AARFWRLKFLVRTVLAHFCATANSGPPPSAIVPTTLPLFATVIDAKSGNVVGTIALGGGPEFAVADGKGTVFVNIEDKNELVAVDSNTLKIKSRWPVAPAGAPTALAMDTAHRRLFSAGRKPQMLVVLDADSGKAIQSFPITGGVDAAVFEPE